MFVVNAIIEQVSSVRSDTKDHSRAFHPIKYVPLVIIYLKFLKQVKIFVFERDLRVM